MASFAYSTGPLHSRPVHSPASSRPRRERRTAHPAKAGAASGAVAASPSSVFDLLYDEYLPFRLYTDYMLGSSAAELARKFALSEHWVAERIEAIRLCIGKQVRLNLLDSARQSRALH